MVFAAISLFAPYPARSDLRGSAGSAAVLDLLFGTSSRGQDVFWQFSFAMRNTLLFGFIVAIISRVLSLAIGLVSGYLGGIDRSRADVDQRSFIVIPLFPILVLFYFVHARQDVVGCSGAGHGLPRLGLRRAPDPLGHDERSARASSRSTSIFSGMSTRQILVEEHLPYVLPIVFSTTMNNINWSIGLEVTLSVLGFTDINTPTIGR